MLRPVRPLRRSVDVSRRTSQGLQSVSNVSLPSSLTGRGETTGAASLAAATGASADTQPTQRTASTLPPLQPCLKEFRSKSSNYDAATRKEGCLFSSSCNTDAAIPQTHSNTAAARKTDGVAAQANSRLAGLPLEVKTSSYQKGSGSDLNWEQNQSLPAAAQKFLHPSEIVQLRTEARLEYYRGRRLQERKDVLHAEEEQRHFILEDARHQIEALRHWERESLEALLRAKSEEALPLQFLELRIQGRIQRDYAAADVEQRREGRAAWRTQVALEKAAAAESAAGEVERRAASHRFRAALTFVVVQEHNMRIVLEGEASEAWQSILSAEEADKAETAHRALVRFLNTPEQLASAAARERRERRQAKAAAKQRKLFEEQQASFVKGCHHGTSGTSVFQGDAAKKICGRCRVKWDDDLGYYVSLDRAVKTHPPPPPLEDASGVAKGDEPAPETATTAAAPLLKAKAVPESKKRKSRA